MAAALPLVPVAAVAVPAAAPAVAPAPAKWRVPLGFGIFSIGIFLGFGISGFGISPRAARCIMDFSGSR
jgi:hypothetical protein